MLRISRPCAGGGQRRRYLRKKLTNVSRAVLFIAPVRISFFESAATATATPNLVAKRVQGFLGSGTNLSNAVLRLTGVFHTRRFRGCI